MSVRKEVQWSVLRTAGLFGKAEGLCSLSDWESQLSIRIWLAR